MFLCHNPSRRSILKHLESAEKNFYISIIFISLPGQRYCCVRRWWWHWCCWGRWWRRCWCWGRRLWVETGTPAPHSLLQHWKNCHKIFRNYSSSPCLSFTRNSEVQSMERIVCYEHSPLPTNVKIRERKLWCDWLILLKYSALIGCYLYIRNDDLRGWVNCSNIDMDEFLTVVDWTVLIREVLFLISTLVLDSVKMSEEDLIISLVVDCGYLKARCSLVLISLVA